MCKGTKQYDAGTAREHKAPSGGREHDRGSNTRTEHRPPQPNHITRHLIRPHMSGEAFFNFNTICPTISSLERIEKN